jgi:hypothetical protein
MLKMFAPAFKMEMIELQCDMYLRNTFREVPLPDCYTFYLSADTFPMLNDKPLRRHTLVLKMKAVENKSRN